MDAKPPSLPARRRRPVAASASPLAGPVAARSVPLAPSLAVALVPALLLMAGPAVATVSPAEAAAPGAACVVGPGTAASLPEPKRVELTPSARAPGARGVMEVGMAASPYGVAVDPDGSYRLRVEVTAEGLRSRDGVHHVVWAATPELDRHVRLGTLGPEGRVAGELAWNKFLVFVTAESSPEPESWSGEILLSGLSPSGRMHTMAGHGPFSGEPCLDPRS